MRGVDEGPTAATGAGWVLGIQGASGGVGATSLTVATALTAAAARLSVAVVDGCPWGGGIDLPAGMECEPGLRWPDLVPSQLPNGAALLPELPQRDGISVLSWPQAPPAALGRCWPVAGALSQVADLVLVDLPPLGAEHGPAWQQDCDDIAMVLGPGVDAFHRASIAVEAVPQLSGLVLRAGGHGLAAEQISAALGVPVLTTVGADDTLETDFIRGEPVGGRGPLAEASGQLLAALLPELRTAG